MANIDDPPYDIIGNGAPTIGNNPKTMPIFTATYMKKAVAKLKQYNFPKVSLTEFPILTNLYVIRT